LFGHSKRAICHEALGHESWMDNETTPRAQSLEPKA
jgi:hypothetical protein